MINVLTGEVGTKSNMSEDRFWAAAHPAGISFVFTGARLPGY